MSPTTNSDVSLLTVLKLINHDLSFISKIKYIILIQLTVIKYQKSHYFKRYSIKNK